MTEILATSIILRIIIAFVALVMLWGLFRALDFAAGLKFSAVMEKMNEEPMAIALYLGCRFLGGCLLLGLLLS